MNLKEIVEILECEVLTPNADLSIEVECAFGADLISDILMRTQEPTLLLSGLTNPQIIRLSDMIDLFGIVFVRGKKPAADLIKMADERGLPLLSTALTMYESCGKLYRQGLRSCKI
ncbi:MAG: transcriptional regulator [Candidatus Cloacimonadales bacterium]